MKGNHVIIVVIVCMMVLLLQMQHIWVREEVVVTGVSDLPTIIIDAGHGGEDGGAVGITGAIESHINLAIALNLEQLLLFYGIEPILLRREDTSLDDGTGATVRERKTADLKQRVALVNDIGKETDAILLSIHQNFFQEEKYQGAQVFYTSQGEEFATQLQELLRISLNSDNNRSAKPVESSVYLMNQILVSGYLIECGFLSNYEEATLLESDEYQLKIACAITAGLFQQQSRLI